MFKFLLNLRCTCSRVQASVSCNCRTCSTRPSRFICWPPSWRILVLDWRPPLASACVRYEEDSWQMTFRFLSLSNFEDNPFLVIEWTNWNQVQSRLIALLVIDVLLVYLTVVDVSIVRTFGFACIQLLSIQHWNNRSAYLTEEKTDVHFRLQKHRLSIKLQW